MLHCQDNSASFATKAATKRLADSTRRLNQRDDQLREIGRGVLGEP
jgi:hypothetical protein